MAEYGTIEYKEERIAEKKQNKQIFLYALKAVVQQEPTDYGMMEEIIKKINSENFWIELEQKELDKLREDKEAKSTIDEQPKVSTISWNTILGSLGDIDGSNI